MADARYGPPPWPPTTPADGLSGQSPHIPRQTGSDRRSPYAAQQSTQAPLRHSAAGTATARSRATVPRHRTDEWRTVDDRRPPPQPPARRTRRADASPWHWLLLVPIVVPLLPGLYNRIDPTLLGVPFFYWCQLGFAFLASGVIAFVHLKVR